MKYFSLRFLHVRPAESHSEPRCHIEKAALHKADLVTEKSSPSNTQLSDPLCSFAS